MKKILLQENGITLIAMIITIIVLIILAGVTVAPALKGELFASANKAKIKTEVLQLQKELEIKKLELAEKGQTISFGTLKGELGIETEYEHILVIENGELVYTSNAKENQIKYFQESGIKAQTTGCYWIVNEKNLENYTKVQGFVGGTLENFRDLVNSKTFDYELVCLAENIELDYSTANQYTPIGTSSIAFDKVFDGKNCTISGIYIDNTSLNYQGLFANNKGTIKNVGIKDSYINAGAYVGGITGHNLGTIENCYNQCNIQGQERIGGITGSTSDTAGSTIISNINNCYNSGKITGTNYVGGIIGQIGRYTNNINNCYNTGEITGTSCIGGILGNSTTSTSIIKCYNNGKISGTSQVGGIAGGIGSSGGSGSVIGCYNLADITFTGQYCGGIVGNVVSPGTNQTGSSVISCYNLAEFIGDSTKTGNTIGGIVGYITYSNVINCYTTSRVDGKTIIGVAIGRSRYGPTNVANVYYLQRAENNTYPAIGHSSTNISGELTGLENTYMKSQEFVSDLSNSIPESLNDLQIVWKYNPGGYPSF